MICVSPNRLVSSTSYCGEQTTTGAVASAGNVVHHSTWVKRRMYQGSGQ